MDERAFSHEHTRRRLGSEVAERILHTIRTRPYRPGEQLPTVTSLAAMFGVAPHTVREALIQLEAFGLIRIRHGSGIYVATDANKLVFGNPFSHHLGLELCLDLLNTRLMLEPRLAALAARHARDTDLDDMEATLREASTYLHGASASYERLNAVNLRFHCLVARSSANSVASNVVDVLARLYSEEQLALLPICEAQRPNYTHLDHRGHEAILEALRSRDAELAEQRMRTHVEDVRNILANHLVTSEPPTPSDERVAAAEIPRRATEGG